jgi:hypothetical protein
LRERKSRGERRGREGGSNVVRKQECERARECERERNREQESEVVLERMALSYHGNKEVKLATSSGSLNT